MLYILVSLLRFVGSLLLISFYEICHGPIYLWIILLLFYDGSKIILLSFKMLIQIFKFFNSKFNNYSLSFAFLDNNNPSERNSSERSYSTIESEVEEEKKSVSDNVLKVLTDFLKL